MSSTPSPSTRIRLTRREWLYLIVGLIVLCLLATAAFLARGRISDTVTSSRADGGINALRFIQPLSGTKLEEDPTFTELEDGTIRVEAAYSGGRQIPDTDLFFYCDTLQIPPPWQVTRCGYKPKSDNKGYVIAIELPPS